MSESKTMLRTRMGIQRAFVELLKQHNFNDISVKDIAEKANITRATFYKYYEDKYHLIGSIIQEQKEVVFEAQPNGSLIVNPCEFCMEKVSALVDFLSAHKQDFVLCLKHSNDERLRNIIFESINSNIEEYLKLYFENKNIKIPVPLLSRYLAGGFVYAGAYFVENMDKYSKQEILNYIAYLFSDAFSKQL